VAVDPCEHRTSIAWRTAAGQSASTSRDHGGVPTPLSSVSCPDWTAAGRHPLNRASAREPGSKRSSLPDGGADPVDAGARPIQPEVHKVCRLVILSGRAAERGAEEGVAGGDRTRSRRVRRCGGPWPVSVCAAAEATAPRTCQHPRDQDVSEVPDRSTTPTRPVDAEHDARGPRNERGSAAIGGDGYAAGHAARR
jgi:hypothetical protein